jgi:hypothetical protein
MSEHTEDQVSSIMEYINVDHTPKSVLSTLSTFIKNRLPERVKKGLTTAFKTHSNGEGAITILSLCNLLKSQTPEPAYANSLGMSLYQIILTFGHYPFPASFFGASPKVDLDVFIRACALLRTTDNEAVLPEITVGDETRVQGLTASRFHRLIYDALATSKAETREVNDGADIEGLEDVLDIITLLQPAFVSNPKRVESMAPGSFPRAFVQHVSEVLPRRVFDPRATVKEQQIIDLVSALGTFTGTPYQEGKGLWGAILPDMMMGGDWSGWEGLSEMEGLQIGRGEGWSGLISSIYGGDAEVQTEEEEQEVDQQMSRLQLQQHQEETEELYGLDN